MAMRPTPSALRKLSGSNLHRLNPNEPRVYCYRKVESVPTPKAVERDAHAKEHWNFILPDLVANGMVTRTNLAILANYCLAYARVAHAEDEVFENGQWLEEPVFNKAGDHVADRRVVNPMLSLGSKFRQEMLRYGIEFGLTPSSSTRVSSNVGEEDEDKGFGSFLGGSDDVEPESKQPN